MPINKKIVSLRSKQYTVLCVKGVGHGSSSGCRFLLVIFWAEHFLKYKIWKKGVNREEPRPGADIDRWPRLPAVLGRRSVESVFLVEELWRRIKGQTQQQQKLGRDTNESCSNACSFKSDL